MDLRTSGAFFCALKTCSIIIDTTNAIMNGKNQKSKKFARKNKNSFIYK